MNRKDLLKAARAAGFTGKTLPELKEWASTEGVVFATDEDGKKNLNIDEAWAKTVTLTIDASDGEDVQVVDGSAMTEMADEDEDDDAPPAMPKRANAREIAKRMAGGNGGAHGKAVGSVRDFGLMAAKKAYTRAAQTGGTFKGSRPVFSDADEAEYFGAAVRLAATKNIPYSQRSRDCEIIGTKAGSTLDNAYAGVLVVHETAPQIIDLLHTFGATRQLVPVTSMPDGEYRVNRKTADMTFAFEGEGDEIAETNPTLDQVRLIANKLAGIGRVNNELLDDSAFNVADIIAKSSASGLAKAEDEAYFNGTGLANFAGVVGSLDSDSKYDATLSGSGWSDYTVEKIEEWLGRIPVEAWRSGTVKVACSQRFWRSVLYRFAPAAGGNTGQMILAGFGNETQYGGIPVVITEVLPSTYQADQTVAIAGSFERGTKFGVVNGSDQIDASDQAYWKNDQFAWRIKERVAFNTHDVGGTASEVIGLQD